MGPKEGQDRERAARDRRRSTLLLSVPIQRRAYRSYPVLKYEYYERTYHVVEVYLSSECTTNTKYPVQVRDSTKSVYR